jgi:hypothetical protein
VFEASIAKRRRKLEKKYGIGHDGSGPYIYTFSDGFKLPLTPLMLREWAIALVSLLYPLSDVLRLIVFTGGECDNHQ